MVGGSAGLNTEAAIRLANCVQVGGVVYLGTMCLYLETWGGMYLRTICLYL